MSVLSRRDFIKIAGTTAGSLVVSTGLTGCMSHSAENSLSQVTFDHGVASGDPGATSMILWTRAQPVSLSEAAGNSVRIKWELATDETFLLVIRNGLAQTNKSRDFTVKIDLQDLQPAHRYYYRFCGANTLSAIGVTRTLPVEDVEQVKLAVFSCSNYPAGYFNAYHDAAQLTDLDAVLHLGDYIYEYPMGGYATDTANQIGRALAADNSDEILSLDDYRKRYATYRGDKGLQAIHACAPFIAVWDDHEVANDTYKDGAENHNPGEGDFFARRAAAIQAYYEWMPIRPPRGEQQPEIYRSFNFAQLLSLHMLDTRVIGRDKQLSYQDYRDGQDNQTFNLEQFQTDLNQPHRTLLGQQQKVWLEQAVRQSTGQWQLLGQQVLMAKMHLPAEVFSAGKTAAVTRIAALKQLTDQQAAGLPLTQQQQQRLAQRMPYNLDAWDGYPQEREELFSLFKSLGKDLIVVAGDTHNAWYNSLRDKHGDLVGVEFATPGVSSPGMESYLDLTDESGSEVAQNLCTIMPDLHYCNLHQRGYMLLTFSPAQIISEWRFVSNIASPDYVIAASHTTQFKA